MVTHTDRQQGISASAGDDKRKAFAATGSILGAIAASSCCILPLVLFSLGVGGAWIGNLAVLNPYQPIFVAVTIGFLGYGYWLVYRRPKTAFSDGTACTPTGPARMVKPALWLATLLVAVATAFPYYAPALLGL